MRKFYTKVASLGVDSEKLPEWYLIFAEGWNELEGEVKYLVDEQGWAIAKIDIDRRGLEIVFDYEHQSLENDQAPAAGWCKQWRYTPGVGIEARIDWTEKAADYLAKGEYRYFSPVFYVRDSDQRLVGIHSVALTNTPKTNNLKPLLAKLGAQHQQQMEETNMLKKLLAKLALGEDATEEQAIAAIDALQTKEPEEVIPKEVVAALDLKDTDGVSTVVASINVLKQETKGMVSRADFEALQTKIAKQDADQAVAAAMKAGKITPDQKDWADEYAENDPDGFQTFVAKAPVVVPVNDLPEGSEKNNDGNIDETTLKVASMFGNTEEDLKKFGK